MRVVHLRRDNKVANTGFRKSEAVGMFPNRYCELLIHGSMDNGGIRIKEYFVIVRVFVVLTNVNYNQL